MDIYINDKKIDFTPGLPLSWRDFFKTLMRGNYIKGSHSIVKMTVDNIDSLEVIMPGKSDEMVPGDIKVVCIFTRESAAVARDGLTKVIPLIENMKTEIAAAAGLFKEGSIKEASGKIAAVMEAFSPMVQFVNSVGISFSMDFDTIMFDDKVSLREKMESFLQTFSEIVSVQREKDYSRMADYLQNQLLQDMTAWERVVDIILKKVEKSEV